MPLILSPRLRPGDAEAWMAASAADAALATTSRFRQAVDDAEMAVLRFTREPCYAGVSWGKDSTVLADLVCRVAPHVPLVWIRVEPIANPDCAAVRDAFLSLHPEVLYDEIEVQCPVDENGPHATGTLERGFRIAAGRHGDRYLSGIRADESAARARRALAGVETGRTAAPLIRWTASHVFAYLAAYGLPVHPVYAMTMGGALDRGRLRVASLGGKRGTGTGRAEWERIYYAAPPAPAAQEETNDGMAR